MNKILLSFIATGGAGLLIPAGAQPVPEDFFSYTRVISDRNIFDPGRQPHNGLAQGSSANVSSLSLHETPGMKLVGIMSYQKGMFAFFDGNGGGLSRVLQVGDKAQGYTITEITAQTVGLESANLTAPSQMKIGGGLRQENGAWVISDMMETSGLETTGAPDHDNAGTTAAPPVSANGQNDVLKRLMEQREKDNQ